MTIEQPPAGSGTGSATGDDGPVHRALADPQRRRLLSALEEAAQPLGTGQLAATLGLHPNTVRWHLRVLEEAGLVTGHAEPRGGRGRPPLSFSLVRQSEPASGEYRLLASLLAGSLAAADGGPALAEASGRAWGEYLVERPEPGTHVGVGEAVTRVLDVLDRHGFDPEQVAEGISLRACPYGEIAHSHGDVVCAAHRGMVEGALAELGAPLRLAELLPLTGPGLCLLRLEPVPLDEHPAA
jgi:predicted ArsR family transcriptional regulator